MGRDNETDQYHKLSLTRRSHLTGRYQEIHHTASPRTIVRKKINSLTKAVHILIIISLFSSLPGQANLEFGGQLSLAGSYAPENELDLFLGGRYIPSLDLTIPLDSLKKIDFEASANLSGSLLTAFENMKRNPSSGIPATQTTGALSPYRAWARYSSKRSEFRIGLQKIDFGSATLLRPLQWFNQIDPRDPLQLTNGVYGALGRYYFQNNANFWAWILYGNEKTRGFDAVETNRSQPEFGGRFQYPVPKGELAFSYHHRTANSSGLSFVPQYDRIPEDRFALDGKWDAGVGIWFEAVYSHKSRDISFLTHQTFLNLGTDYTFDLGNGLNVILEHLAASFDPQPMQFENTSQLTAITMLYPLGLFDNLSSVVVYNWTSEDFTLFLNYQHQFKHMTSYLMAFYNPDVPSGIQQNELVNQFSGPGIRAMVVFNH